MYISLLVNLEKIYEDKFAEAKETAEASKNAWIFPFLLIALSIIILSIFLYTRYKKVLKTHLL